MTYLGIIFALIALFCWGLGDFFIQRASRKTGIVDALFYITALAAVALLPFIWKDLASLNSNQIAILISSGVIVFLASLLQFKALEVGKLAVIEPICSLELPITVIIAGILGREHLSVLSYFIIALVFIGIFVAVMPHKHYLRNLGRMEKGSWLAFGGAFGMALTNFIIGYASQQTSPLLSIWATHTIIAILCVVLLLHQQKLHSVVVNFVKFPLVSIAEAVADNVAWIAYAFAVIYIPISIAVTIGESYIILAVLLGIFFNQEKLKHHQYFGVTLAIGGVLLLAMLSN